MREDDPDFEKRQLDELEGRHSRYGMEWTPLSEIEAKSIRFAEKPLLQHEAFHLVTGRKGAGKGTVLASIAARVTNGEFGDKRRVLWIASEDSAAIDIRPRLDAVGGDINNVRINSNGWLELPRDYEWLSNSIESFGSVGMLVIDPVANHIAGLNSNSESDIRSAIAPLNALADAYDCMVFGVRHLTEKEAQNGVLAAILGSSAWVQTPRAVLAVVKDDEESALVHVQVVAGNRLPPGPKGDLYQIEGVKLDYLEEEVTRAVRVGASEKDLDAVIGRTASDKSTSAQARELVLNLLDEESPRESGELDRLVIEELELRPQSMKNLRSKMAKAGLIRQWPERGEDGAIARWMVGRERESEMRVIGLKVRKRNTNTKGA